MEVYSTPGGQPGGMVHLKVLIYSGGTTWGYGTHGGIFYSWGTTWGYGTLGGF